MRSRYGISFFGLILASGAGVFLGTVPIGYVAMIATAFGNTPLLAALPGALGLGAIAGLVVAYGTRRKIWPRMVQRRRRFVFAGMVTMPGCLFIGQLPHLTTSQTAAQWAIGFVLCCGAAGMVVYYQWRKRLTLHQRARRIAARKAHQQSASR